MRRRYDYMPIDAASGTVVYFWKPGNGYPHDRERCERLGLKKYGAYTVAMTDIHQSSTTLYLREFPKERFNTVMFAIDKAKHRSA